MFHILISLALAGSLALAPAVAGATDRPAVDAASTDHQVTDDQVTDRQTDRRHHDLRFDCRAKRSDRGPVIGCAWTAVGEDRAAGYRLWRSVDGGARNVVFETRNNRMHAHRELVRPGHRYAYAVQYIAEDGSVLHTSHVEHVAIPAASDRATD